MSQLPLEHRFARIRQLRSRHPEAQPVEPVPKAPFPERVPRSGAPMGLQALVRRRIGPYQIDVSDQQVIHKQGEDPHKRHQDDIEHKISRAVSLPEPPCEEYAHLSHKQSLQHSHRHNEHEEVSVVSFPDAGAQPRTMVVESLDAGVANVAVHHSGRPPSQAGPAGLYWQIMRLDARQIELVGVLHGACQYVAVQGDVLRTLVFKIRQDLLHDARVNEGQKQKRQRGNAVKDSCEYHKGDGVEAGGEDVVEGAAGREDQMGEQVLPDFGAEWRERYR